MMKTWARTLVLVLLAGYVGVAQQPASRPAPAAPQPPVATTARPQPTLATGTPESVGISSERLDRLHRGMQAYVDRREAGGIVTLIAREGKIVDVHASGFQDVESRKPMQTDTVFRIASMTKPITSDPVSKFIPAFKSQRVIAEDGSTLPARRQATVRDLLSQPGSAWNYSLSVDVLGRIVEVVSGMSFDAFLRERIFKPLGMPDTAFEVSDAKWPRLATVYSPDGAGGMRPMKDPESFGNTQMSPLASYKAPKRYFSGGAGLTSTARDYARFAQMLLNGGSLDGVRLLGPKTIEFMMVQRYPGSTVAAGFQPLVYQALTR